MPILSKLDPLLRQLSFPLLLALSSLLSVLVSWHILTPALDTKYYELLVPMWVSLVALAYHRFRQLLLPFLIIILLAGFHFTIRYQQSSPTITAELDTVVIGEVISLPERNQRRTRVLIKITNITSTDTKLTNSATLVGQHVQVTTYQGIPDLQGGERVRLSTTLSPAGGARNPAGFDYRRYFRSRGIQLQASLSAADQLEILEKVACCRVTRWRSLLRERLSRHREHPQYPLMLALVLGDRSAMTEAERTILQGTGTSHLLAISGLHIGMVASAVWLLFFTLLRQFPTITARYPAPTLAAILSLAPAFFYALLAGLSFPTIRALLMLSILVVTLIQYRLVRLLDIWALALFGTLLSSPLSVLSVGFWLSFYATLLIIIFLSFYQTRHGRVDSFSVIDIGWLQAAISLGMLPIGLSLFGAAAPLAPLANLIAIPWASFAVIPLLLLGSMLAFVLPNTADTLLSIGLWTLDLLWQWLEVVAALSTQLPTFSLPAPHLSTLWLSPLLIPAVAMGFSRWRWNLIAMMVLILLWFPVPSFSTSPDRLTIFAQRSGFSAILEQQSRSPILIGAGDKPFGAKPNVNYTVKPYLQKYQLSPSALLLPYLKQQMTGGVAKLRQIYPHMTIYSPKANPALESFACPDFQHDHISARLWDDPELPSCLIILSLDNDGSTRKIIFVPTILLDAPSRFRLLEWINRKRAHQDRLTLVLMHAARKPFDANGLPPDWFLDPQLTIILSGKWLDATAHPAILGRWHSTAAVRAITVTAASIETLD